MVLNPGKSWSTQSTQLNPVEIMWQGCRLNLISQKDKRRYLCTSHVCTSLCWSKILITDTCGGNMTKIINCEYLQASTWPFFPCYASHLRLIRPHYPVYTASVWGSWCNISNWKAELTQNTQRALHVYRLTDIKQSKHEDFKHSHLGDTMSGIRFSKIREFMKKNKNKK